MHKALGESHQSGENEYLNVRTKRSLHRVSFQSKIQESFKQSGFFYWMAQNCLELVIQEAFSMAHCERTGSRRCGGGAEIVQMSYHTHTLDLGCFGFLCSLQDKKCLFIDKQSQVCEQETDSIQKAGKKRSEPTRIELTRNTCNGVYSLPVPPHPPHSNKLPSFLPIQATLM